MRLPKDICGRVIHEGDQLLCVDADYYGIVVDGRIYRAGQACGYYLTSIEALGVYNFRPDRFLNIEKFLNGEL